MLHMFNPQPCSPTIFARLKRFQEGDTPNRVPVPSATTPLPLRTSTVAPRPNINSVAGEDDDFDILILEKEDVGASTAKTSNIFASEQYQTQTMPFRDFDIRCPVKTAVRSIFLKKIESSTRADLIFALKCARIPYFVEEIDHHFIERLEFSASDDGSLQSPCNPLRGLFLCGLQGTYDQIRKLRAHCCFISFLKINLSTTPVSQVLTINGIELLPLSSASSTEQQFVSNIDRLKDGTFVAQIVTFSSNYRS
uniref:Uncharacterized protein n=1 Tax=Romanomermis culicivorax TaxID=13658 RepID=A0A915J9L8_ROMCU